MRAVTEALHPDHAPSPRADRLLYGAVEAGGTKWVCAAGSGPADIIDLEVIPTTTPDETLSRVVAFFSRVGSERLAGLGVGSFGPVDLRRESSTFGTIMNTAKPGWTNADVVGTLADALDLPVAFDTDVNAAALGEARWGAARGLSDVVYITVGTGIGAGLVVNGRPVHGLMHPEFGHMLIPQLVTDSFAGACPFHGNCLEGLASGQALRARYGNPAEQLDDPGAWELEAHYLAVGIANVLLLVSPERILVGGGVMKKAGLIEAIRARVHRLIAGYVELDREVGNIDHFIVAPALGDRAGVLGALQLAIAASAEVRD